MEDEIKEILDKFDKVLENYELDKKWGQMSVDSICHLFPNEMIVIKDCITNLQEEVEDLREDNYAYHQLMKMQNKREYRSKFLKEFQEEYGTNTFPDYDEIYKRYDKMKKENEKLKNGYCELKVKCNNGECDCTNEEYEDMVQANIKGSLLLDDYKSRIDKAIEYINRCRDYHKTYHNEDKMFPDELTSLIMVLQGSDEE